MSRNRRPPLTARDITVLVAIGLASIAIISAQVAAYTRLAHLTGGGGSLFTAWSGARAYLFQHDDPYGAETAIAATELTHGELAPAGGNPRWLNLPFFLVPALFPLALISDPAVARALWAFLSELALFAAVFLTMAVIDWHPPRRLTVGLCLLIFLSYYSIAALMDGTLSLLLILAYVGILWAAQSERDELAGALAVFALCLWEVGLPFLVLVAWRFVHKQRWRVLAGFGMTLTILLTISFLLYPGWFLPFLTATLATIRAPHGLSTLAILPRLPFPYGDQIAQGITIVVLSTLVYEWAAARDADFRRFVWVSCLALTATPLMGIRSEIVNLVALVPSLILILAGALQRRPPLTWLGVSFLVFAFSVPWLLFWRWIGFHDQRAEGLLFLFLPCITLLGMYWTRWWFLRPSRTWLDEVRAAQG